jgi:hypothetical protein
LSVQNDDLLKYLHKSFNKHDNPWVHLVWSYYTFTVPPPFGFLLVVRHLQAVRLIQAISFLPDCSSGATDGRMWESNSPALGPLPPSCLRFYYEFHELRQLLRQQHPNNAGIDFWTTDGAPISLPPKSTKFPSPRSKSNPLISDF